MRPFTTVAAAIFLVVAAGHLTRLVLGWEATLNGWPIPLWISGFGAVVPAILSGMLFREARRGKTGF
jgi:hypothetical protein